MDAGSAQIISSVVTGIISLLATIITGYFMVRAAQVKANEKGSGEMRLVKPHKSWLALIPPAIAVSIFSCPTGFAIAYTGNSLTGVSANRLFGDSLDPAMISIMLSFIGYFIGAWTTRSDMEMGSTLLVFVIVSIVAAPVSYSVAYLGNWLSGTPDHLLFEDSFDSLVVGAMICSISFVIGTFTSSASAKSAT